MLAVESPFRQFYDLTGAPLQNGSLYFGTSGQNPETNPVTVYWDAAGTQPVAQPARTVNGYPVRAGSPAMIYASGDMSVTVRDAKGRIVVSVPSINLFSNTAALQTQLADKSNAAYGANLVGFNPTLNYASGTIGQHLGVEWNPQDYPWLAKFDGVTDDTTALQACLTAIYNAGGGIMRLPRGVTRLSTISLNFAVSRSVLIRGAGRNATTIRQIGGGSTPMIQLSAPTNVLDVYSELSDFTIDGVGKTAHGVQATTIANIYTRNLGIINCDTGFNSLGCLESNHDKPSWNSNNRGYACAVSSAIYPNLVNFRDGSIKYNTTWNVDITHGSNINFSGTDLSSGGTSANLSTGCLNTATTIAAETGFALLNFDGVWFENGLGQPINVQSAGGLHAMFVSTKHDNPEGHRTMLVGAIGSITLLNPIGASPGDTITIGACGASNVIGGVATVVDSSVQQFRSGLAGSSASPGTTAKNLQILASGSVRLDPTAKIQDTGGSFTQGNPIVTFQDGAGAGGSVVLYAANGGGGNAAATVLKLTSNSSNSRSINAGGTVNASGADYAEYETKRSDCGSVAPGQIIGFDSAGLVTDKFSLSVSFGVKSTAPSIVGGDTWSPGEPPLAPQSGADASAVAAYEAALTAFNAALEAARQKVDRIAYAGKVPVNVMGATPGQFVLVVDDGSGGIKGIASATDGANCVGRVRKVLPDGRAQIVVKAA